MAFTAPTSIRIPFRFYKIYVHILHSVTYLSFSSDTQYIFRPWKLCLRTGIHTRRNLPWFRTHSLVSLSFSSFGPEVFEHAWSNVPFDTSVTPRQSTSGKQDIAWLVKHLALIFEWKLTILEKRRLSWRSTSLQSLDELNWFSLTSTYMKIVVVHALFKRWAKLDAIIIIIMKNVLPAVKGFYKKSARRSQTWWAWI